MKSDEECVRICQGSEVIAMTRLDGTIVDCSSEGVNLAFGMSRADVLSKNIVDLLDSSVDRVEFEKLSQIRPGCSRAEAETTCLLRTKGKRTFVWADRYFPYGDNFVIESSAVFPIRETHSPDLSMLATASRTKTSDSKKYCALDTTDMSFNDVFEDIYASKDSKKSMSGNLSCGTSPAISEQSLIISSTDSTSSNLNNRRESDMSEEDSNWGWFKTISPSSSATFSNMTSQIRLL